MHIHQLTLERFRGAHSLSLALHERMNVLAGVNGSGKSSILDAAAILLSWLANRIKHVTASGRPISESDIKNGAASANLAITLNEAGLYFGWNLAKTRAGHSSKEVVSVLIAATETAKQKQALMTQSDGHLNLPLFVYYPVNRAVLDIPLRIRAKHRFDILSAYDDALMGGANFRTFFEWFREREDLENEAYRGRQSLFAKESGSTYPDAQLEAVRTALSRFMPDFKNLTVRRNPLRMEVEKEGQRLTVNQLSDGEKCLMALVGDLARRLAIANPVRDDPLQGEGIVLIDEVDLHLHPLWQRKVVPKLAEVFPNCQFLISTHSPHVLTHVRPENLFLLQMDGQNLQALRPSECYGKTADRVLEDLMGLSSTRPMPVQGALSRLYEQIEQGGLEEAKSLISELEQNIGSDPELARAGVLIRRKELIGR